MLPVYVPSKGRSQTISTHALLEGIDYTIVVHNEQEKEAYLKNESISANRLVVSHQPYEISLQRQWILNRVPVDSWLIMMDDNIKRFTALEEPYYWEPSVPVEGHVEFRKRFARPITAQELLHYIGLDIAYADQVGAHLIGFGHNDNYFYRNKKYSFVGHVVGKLVAVKKSVLQYNPCVFTIDDLEFTAQHLLRFGKVLLNKYIYPVAEHYQPGGLGTYEQREKRRIEDCRYMMHCYPGLYRYKQVPGKHPHQDISFRFYKLEQVQAWRHAMMENIP